jgi:uncharacterized repeat protein (TIGR01451 family)
VTRLTRLVVYALAVGVALVLLGACAQQEEPTPSPESMPLSARAAVPAPVSASPSSVEPHTQSRSLVDPASSVADLALRTSTGETSVYTLTVRNLGPDPATGIVLTDTFSGGVIPVWTEPALPGCEREGREVLCDLGALQTGDAATVTLDVSAGGTEMPITYTRNAQAPSNLPVLTCALDRNGSPTQMTCYLSRLEAGAEAQVRVGTSADGAAAGACTHTAAITAHETDPDRSNNRITSSIAAGAVAPAADLAIQAEGPQTVFAGRPFTYTYVITNQGESEATGVWFEDAIPSDMNLVAYAPGLPRCEQSGDLFTCSLPNAASGEPVSFTLRITGYGEQPVIMSLDPLLPGWPICSVIKERTWMHIVQCELGTLAPGQASRVELVLEAIGVVARTSANTATVRASEADLNPIDNSSTATITIQIADEPGGG